MPVYNRWFLDKDRPSSKVLKDRGPRISVEIHIPRALASFLTQKGEKIPSPITGSALVDTGASISAVDNTAVCNLGIQQIGVTQVLTPGGKQQQYLYAALLSFPEIPLTVEISAVIGSSLKEQGIIALIGRDVLSKCILIYNGPEGFISLAY